MPDSTFLHIQGRESSTTRMIELPIGPVRVGRGAHCEVRLAEPGLGEVECLLRRRGNTWHYQPVGPTGRVWIDGRVADQQRPLPLGVPFRVGDHWLTLRPADSATNDWESPQGPISVVIEAGPPVEAPGPGSPEEPDRSRHADASAEEERLRRWHARLEQRERMLQGRQEERRWEARWKSAGESLRARAASPAPTAPPSRATPNPSPAAPPPTTSRAPQTPPVSRIIEPRAAEPLRRVADPRPRPAPTRAISEPTGPTAVGPQAVRVAIRPRRVEIRLSRSIEPDAGLATSPISRALVTLPAPRVDRPVARAVPPERADPTVPGPRSGAPTLPIGPGGAVECRVDAAPEAPGEILPGVEAEEGHGPGPVVAPLPADPLCFETRPIGPVSSDPGPVAGAPIAAIEGRSSEPSTLRDGPTTGMADPSAPGLLPSRQDEGTAWTVPSTEPGVPAGVPALSGAGTLQHPTGTGLAHAEWPSARAIFASQARRPPEVAGPARRPRPRAIEPLPTDPLAPSRWALPRWLGLLPVALAVLVAGPLGLVLSYGWALESNSASLALRLALRAEGSPGQAIDESAIPRGPWWTSTATHLAAWAVALQRAGDGEDHSEDIRSLLEASRNASPLAARARFVIGPAGSPSGPGGATDLSQLGRTRDVVSLASTGRWLSRSGKREASLRAYRSAMEIASKAGRDDLGPPAFSEESQVRRYALPHEGLIGMVVSDMVASGDWTSEQWAGVLPPTASASLVAARVLAGAHKRAEADQLADLAIGQAASSPPPGYDPAEHLAAGAEALAYRGRWTDAAARYRLAIGQVDDDLTRRMWWLNLAELALRGNDETGRALAIEAAKAPDGADEVTRRALKIQQNLAGLAAPGARRQEPR